MNTDEILKMVEWYASRRVDHFRLATRETEHDICASMGAIKYAVNAALSQAEANRVDAERYRWLRDLPAGSEHEQIGNFPGDWWDEAIDNARLTNAVKTKS